MGDRPRTRVFMRHNPNFKLTVYLGKRDFVDHMDHVDPVDGVLLVDPDYLKDCKVFVTLTCVFRCGNEGVDVLGLSFRKDLYTSTIQAFPPLQRRHLSHLQERLLQKLGQNAYPFTFTIPLDLPCSMTIQSAPDNTEKASGVSYELQVFSVNNSAAENIQKRNLVEVVLRKFQYAPEMRGPQPIAEASRSFLMSDRVLHLEASLDKELYYHGEIISVNVHVTNNSSKTVKRIKIQVCQYSDICLHTETQYIVPVAQLEADDPVPSSSTSFKVYNLTPVLGPNRLKTGLALDGEQMHEDTNLASSSIVKEGCDKELMVILVSYRVIVKLVVSLGGDVTVELPFILMQPKPADCASSEPQSDAAQSDAPIDPSLVRLDMTTPLPIDDFVFEEFTRAQLPGPSDVSEVDSTFI